MNCQEALSLLYDIIDKESSEIDAKEVKEHLDKCKHCFEAYRLEQSIQNFIDEKLAKDQSPAKLDHLKNKIMQNLDELDSCHSDKSKKNSFFRLPVVLIAAAASIAILIGTAFISNAPNDHDKYYVPLEQAHWAAVENASTGNNTDLASLINDAYQSYRYQIDNTVGSFQLISGHYEEILDAHMLHFIYKDNGRLVSVFIASDSEFDLPPDLKEKGVIHNNIKLFDHDCKGCRLVYQKQGSTIIITASADKDVDLMEFIPGRSSI
ncbi:MAG: zf-HC2 domain-containing protein [bacterium]